MLRAFEFSAEIMRKMVEDKDKRNGAFTVMGGLADAPKLFGPIARCWMSEPQKFQAAPDAARTRTLVELWGRACKRFLGEPQVGPVCQTSPGDPRFQDREWTEERLLRFACGRPICIRPASGPRA